MNETVDFIDQKIKKNEFIQQVVVNVAKLVHMQKDQDLFNSVMRSIFRYSP